MMVLWFVAIPLVGGLAAWASGRLHAHWPRWVALAALTVNLLLCLWLVVTQTASPAGSKTGAWLLEVDYPWIPAFGIHFHLAVDGLSLILILLTNFLGIVAVACSWTEITHQRGLFFGNLLGVLAGIIGVFTALDLFLFYFFWELMMVPMFLLIVIWGHANRIYAGIKFFLFTQISGLLMLAAIVGLYWVHGRTTGHYTFGYPALLNTAMSSDTAMVLMLGFLAAFAVKLPVFPLHTWLPDAHTEAPTAGSVVLAGLLLKTGAYGLIRFVVPLFPFAAKTFAPIGMALAVVGIIYGAVLAFSQTDLKRLVAYTSVSHMGFVMLAVFAWQQLALQGAVIQIICHGISTGALFVLVGVLQERLHTRDLNTMGGLWRQAPRMGGIFTFFALASLGLPGLGNFVGEFLILMGVYPVSLTWTVIAALGLITAAVYALWVVQNAFHGPAGQSAGAMRDLSVRETATLSIMAAAIVWIGLYPQPILNTFQPTMNALLGATPVHTTTAPANPPSGQTPHLFHATYGDAHAVR